MTIILLATLAAFLLTSATLLVVESFKRKQAQDPQLRARLALLGRYLRFS